MFDTWTCDQFSYHCILKRIFWEVQHPIVRGFSFSVFIHVMIVGKLSGFEYNVDKFDWKWSRAICSVHWSPLCNNFNICDLIRWLSGFAVKLYLTFLVHLYSYIVYGVIYVLFFCYFYMLHLDELYADNVTVYTPHINTYSILSFLCSGSQRIHIWPCIQIMHVTRMQNYHHSGFHRSELSQQMYNV